MTARRRLAAALVVAALAASAQAAPPDPASPLDALRPAIARQDELVAKDRLDVLLSEARAKARDGTPEALYLLGRALGNAAVRRRETDAAESQRLLEESQRCFEDAKESGVVVFAPAYLGLGRCARFRGDLDGSAAHLRQALKLAPAFREASIELAEVLAEKGAVPEAEFVLHQALGHRPKDADLHVALGWIKLGRRRLGEAEREFRLVLQEDAKHATALKLLAATLVAQQEYAEAAERLETYRRLEPKDEEAYRALFFARVKLKQRDAAVRVLHDLRNELPGTESALWAEQVGEQYAQDPDRFETADERTPEALVRRLEAKDPAVLLATLTEMRAFRWPALPGGVYKLLAPAAAPGEVRRAAVELIGMQEDPRTLTLLEIVLFHPQERDPDASVRRAAARAIAGLPSKGALPVLWRALDDADADVREAAVQGIARSEGKVFREKLEVATPADAWPAERALYDRWWRTASASISKRDACEELRKLFEPIQKGRRRLAEYALPAMADENARTWRAGYDLFRALTGQDFGAAAGEPAADERGRITEQARQWFAANGHAE